MRNSNRAIQKISSSCRRMLHCKQENLVLSNQRFYSMDEQVDYIDTLSVRSRLQEKHYSVFKGEIQKLQEIRFSDLKRENQKLTCEAELRITNCEENDKVLSRELSEVLRTERSHIVTEIHKLIYFIKL
ncbi:uncharacterized protein LOC110864429 [Helianthus annuus]|uniref:uncharacterized protein LOC110864429 n=1 Tax=Helianthus annuus TaxID=4232 RepID=UPI000B8FF23E|nr:uncharacterized protein LOC110864429 [Helianthus annuus]XP_035830221.1 uncharacterized protein LOC110864429 [Helianthus annuus]